MPLDAQTAATGESAFLRRPLRVQNLEPNKTVFAKVVDGNMVKVDFAAKGYSGDTQRVPMSIINDTDFLNSLEAGVLKVVDGPAEVLEALQFETEQVRREREESASKHIESLDRRQDRDIVGATCIGPAPTGREGTCGRALIQSAKQQGEQPPLCEEHSHLFHKFYLAETGSKGQDATESRDGVVRREWREVTVTERQKVQ